MSTNKFYKTKWFKKLLGISGLAAAFILGGLPLAAQQQDQDTVPGYPAPGGQGPADSAPPPPNAGNQTPPNGAPPYPPPNAPQNSSLPGANQTAPASLTLPAGTIVQIRTNEWLSTDRNLPGDGFHATLDQPVVAVGGWVVAQRGQNVLGRVTMSQKANSSNHNQSQLGLTLSEMTFVDGQLLPIETQFVQNSAPSDPGRNVGIVGSTTGAGAVIGAIAGGATGAAVGAGVGAIAGLGIISTHGRPTMIPPETLLTFQLKSAVTVSTEKSKFAFRPITPADYSANLSSSRGYQQNQGGYEQGEAGQGGAYPQGEPGAYPPTPPPPAPPYYAYPYAYSPYYYPGYYGYYPAFGFGYGYGYGWGPRYYGRFGGRFR
jgi:hypothetical protein